MIRTFIKRLIAPKTACQVCYQDSKLSFEVDDYYWDKIVPRKLRDKNICLGCFDGLAYQTNTRYKLALLSFKGSQESFNFWGA